jgi:hypothetical protein
MNPESSAARRSAWPWPDSLDAMAAAPRHHTLLLENERVRVLVTRIERGDIVPLHTHRWSSVYHVLSWSDFVRRDAEGEVLFDSRTQPPVPAVPFVLWSGPLPPHTVENVGPEAIHILSVEIKD